VFENKSVGVVVPAYNEELLIGKVIETTPDFIDWIIVVDDTSQDKTADIVRSYLPQMGERLILIQHPENQGVGGAIATGYKWCRDHKVDIAVVMAGDAQMDPDDLPTLLEPIVREGVDYTKGNRLFTGDAWYVIPRVRYLGNSMMSFLTKIASGYWHVADSQSGYTAINLRALETIDWDLMYKRYGQPNDLLVRLNIYNFKVRDVPIKPVYGIGEKSGFNPFRMVPKLSLLLSKLFVYRMFHKYVIRDSHPLLFFYVLGGILFPIGFVFGLYLFFRRIIVGPIAGTSALFAVFLIIMGLQFLFFAMWFDMDYNKDLR